MSELSNNSDDSALIADALRRELGLGAGVERFSSGSVPVFALGDRHVVKLFPAVERAHFDSEHAALAHVGGRLSIPTPGVIATGERGNWLYVVMTRMAGCGLVEAWPMIEARDRTRLMHQIGAALAELHALSSDHLAPLAVDWPRFVEAQRMTARERQVAKGLASPWIEQVDDFLAKWRVDNDGKRALLHTEIMREHLLVERTHDGWRISGLIDFEPAMIGAPEYDLASIGIFVACAEHGMLRAVLESYGAKLDEGLPMRIMAYALLHRYSNLRWYLERLPVPKDATTLEQLARSWFTP